MRTTVASALLQPLRRNMFLFGVPVWRLEFCWLVTLR